MINIEPQEYETYRQWIVNTKTRWCPFLIQRYFYDEGVVLEEIDYEDDRILEQYVLEDFNPKSLPFFNQEKDQIIVITLKEQVK
jgi:hypothetical protein